MTGESSETHRSLRLVCAMSNKRLSQTRREMRTSTQGCPLVTYRHYHTHALTPIHRFKIKHKTTKRIHYNLNVLITLKMCFSVQRKTDVHSTLEWLGYLLTGEAVGSHRNISQVVQYPCLLPWLLDNLRTQVSWPAFAPNKQVTTGTLVSSQNEKHFS